MGADPATGAEQGGLGDLVCGRMATMRRRRRRSGGVGGGIVGSAPPPARRSPVSVGLEEVWGERESR